MNILRPYFSESAKKQAAHELLESTRANTDYVVLLIGSILIATGAIFIDSIAVLIASMIIAPLATPILALALGIVTGYAAVIMRAVAMLIGSIVVSLLVAGVLAYFFDADMVKDTYISFSSNHIVAIAIAVVAGYVGAYGLLSQKVAGVVTGVAIAVSLMPPLVATSINLVTGDISQAIDAAVLFGLNVLGILLAGIIAFWQFGVRSKHMTA